MIYSMTAFSRAQNEGAAGSLVCEIRSINHRYLEMSLHLPEGLRALEMPIRDLIRQHVKRGKIECVVKYQADAKSKSSEFIVNSQLAQALQAASQKIAAIFVNTSPSSLMDILRFPGVLVTEEADLSQLQSQVFALLEQALKELVSARGREGEELKQLFLQRMETLQGELGKVRQRLPSIINEQQERLRKRFAEAKMELDPARLEQEIVIFAQRTDVAEEIDRTETHIAELRRILKEGGLAGRRLDFLLQELNREANTLGSKSVDPIVTHAAVEMKVLIEQVREQVQNVE